MTSRKCFIDPSLEVNPNVWKRSAACEKGFCIRAIPSKVVVLQMHAMTSRKCFIDQYCTVYGSSSSLAFVYQYNPVPVLPLRKHLVYAYAASMSEFSKAATEHGYHS